MLDGWTDRDMGVTWPKRLLHCVWPLKWRVFIGEAVQWDPPAKKKPLGNDEGESRIHGRLVSQEKRPELTPQAWTRIWYNTCENGFKTEGRISKIKVKHPFGFAVIFWSCHTVLWSYLVETSECPFSSWLIEQNWCSLILKEAFEIWRAKTPGSPIVQWHLTRICSQSQCLLLWPSS